ncbi:hypothetical protein ACCT17_34140 [Rhizobium ruizarguesonis]
MQQPQPAVCLQGEAAGTGFEIVHIGPREARTYFDVGTYIWTEKARTPYTIISRTDEAEEAVIAILNAKTDNQLGAFTSRYGSLWHVREQRGGDCVALDELRRVVGDLRRLSDTLLAGDFTEANPLPNGLIMSPHAVAFNLWLVPKEDLRGFSPMFMTYSLYTFLAHELITRALGNRPLLVCNACHDYQRSARKDCKFCSPKCRQANHRATRASQPGRSAAKVRGRPSVSAAMTSAASTAT